LPASTNRTHFPGKTTPLIASMNPNNHPLAQLRSTLGSLSDRIPGQVYLWLAIPILGAASAITRKITEIGAQSFVGGRNPVSFCNVLFVGNLCALAVLLILYRQHWNRATLSQFSRREWAGLVIIAALSGALVPGLVFQALSQTQVANVVLVSRLGPPLTVALSVWLLQERVNRWQVMGEILAFLGVVLTVWLQPAAAPQQAMGGGQIGLGELLVVLAAIASAIAAILSKKWLARVPLGVYSTVRTGLGTVIFFCIALTLYGHDHFADALSPFLWKWMLLYGVIIVVVGQSFWVAGLRTTSVAAASIVSSFNPIVGIFAAYLILGEVPTQAQYIGGGVILCGLFLSQVGLRWQMARQTAGPITSVPAEQSIGVKLGFKGV
jgi:drug/metabolite transporter (DMT)-like permease